MNEEIPKQGGRPNKSAQKRERAALQELAERMVELSDGELKRLDVDPDLRQALAQVRSMRPSGARNRQLKHCLRFMESDAMSEVEVFLDNRRSARVADNQAFHAVENWRDRLLAGGDEALSELFDQFPDLDRQRVRQACRDAIREAETGKPAGAKRRLFKLLREVMVPAKR